MALNRLNIPSFHPSPPPWVPWVSSLLGNRLPAVSLAFRSCWGCWTQERPLNQVKSCCNNSLLFSRLPFSSVWVVYPFSSLHCRGAEGGWSMGRPETGDEGPGASQWHLEIHKRKRIEIITCVICLGSWLSNNPFLVLVRCCLTFTRWWLVSQFFVFFFCLTFWSYLIYFQV